MVYDYETYLIIDNLRTHPNLKAYNFVLFNATLHNIRRNVIWFESMVHAVAKTAILKYERACLNITCFSKESNVEKHWDSWSFIHPWYNKMKAFTKKFFEAGMFELFWKIERNKYRLPVRSERGSRNDESFIKFKEAQPVFLICLVSLTTAIAAFAMEYQRRLCLACRLAFFKSSLRLNNTKTGESAASAAKGQPISFTVEESVVENLVSEFPNVSIATLA